MNFQIKVNNLRISTGTILVLIENYEQTVFSENYRIIIFLNYGSYNICS